MLKTALAALNQRLDTPEQASAHCDGPCGVYDPASVRIAAEAAVSMTKKILALQPPVTGDAAGWAAYLNTLSRYVAIKEEQAHIAKTELLVLWTDYFKPPHVAAIQESHGIDLHDFIWKMAKNLSAVKVEVSAEHAAQLMADAETLHNVFWATKNRKVAWYTAS
ncbi:MAG: superoxide dismutase, Ni [Alphaproteobacteria bacterium]|nr:superoxide dismutase, Ni [Alphaproteobacteria bacterium]